MKRALLLLLLSALLLTACSPAAIDPAPVGELLLTPGQSGSEHEGVALEYRGVEYDGKDIQLQLRWRNWTAHDAIFGASFSIDRLENGQWISCAKEDPVFIALAYELPAFWKQDETYVLTEQFDLSRPGTYRFITDCSLGDSKPQLWLEFTLAETSSAPLGVIPGQSETTHQGVTLTLSEDSGLQSLTVLWQNSTEYEVVFGAHYTIERQNLGIWVSCAKSEDIAFDGIGYLLSPGQTRPESYDLTYTYDISQPGTYRFRSDCYIQNPAHPDKITLQLEFTVSPTKLHPSADDTVLETPPALMLETAEGSSTAAAGGHSWQHQTSTDTWMSEICDAQHPLYCQALLSPISTAGNSLLLVFDTVPDSLSVECWPDTAWETSNVPSEKPELYGASLTLNPGGWIYSVSATWDKSDRPWYGTASYYFYCIQQPDHAHILSQVPHTVADPVTGYCGNTVTKLELDGQMYSFMCDESIALTDTLINLDYCADTCRCIAEYKVQTEWGTYEINLTQAFARCEDGQADLTQAQIDTIQKVIDWVKSTKPQL